MPSIDFSLLGQVVRLAEATGTFNPFANCTRCYIEHYRVSKFDREYLLALELPEAFLRKVAGEHMKLAASRDEE